MQEVWRLLRVLRESVWPAVSASGKMDKVIASLVYLGLGTWALLPTKYLAAVSLPARLAAVMSVLALAFLWRAYSLQAEKDRHDDALVLVKDKMALIAALQDRKKQGEAYIYIASREGAVKAKRMADQWSTDLVGLIFNEAGRTEYQRFSNARASTSRFLSPDAVGEQRRLILTLQGQLDVVDEIIERLHVMATEEADVYDHRGRRR